jgi:hypothetical protein
MAGTFAPRSAQEAHHEAHLRKTIAGATLINVAV